MKVLLLPSYYFSPEHPTKGIFFRDQAQALLRAQIEVEVLVNEARSLRELSFGALWQSHGQRKCGLESGILTVRQLGWNPGVSRTSGGRRWSEQTVSLFRWYQSLYGPPDVIHAHNSIWAGYAAFLIRERFGIPYVITEHSSAFRSQTVPIGAEKLIRLAYDNAECRISVSSALACALRSYVSEPIEVIPNVVDTMFFKPPNTPRGGTTFVFLAIGNLLEEKGFQILLRAFAGSFREMDNLVLRIGGSGPERSRLEQLADDLGIRSQVEFLGRMDRESVRSAMQAANAFVLPSFQETFGVVLIEAMSTGIPAISTRCGGPEEIITADTGFLTRPGDVEELGRALRAVRDRSWSGDLIRHSVEARFDSSVIGATLVNVYRSAMESGSGRRNAIAPGSARAGNG